LALMTCADDWSQLVVEAANISNLRIPEDIAILGVDNDVLICELSDPPLSSIKQDSEIIGFEAAYLLDQIIKGKKVPIKNIVGTPINVIIRQSTDICAVNDPNLVKALNFINEYAIKNHLNVDKVVNATHLSRRLLEKKFKQYIGSTIGDRINNIRINAICEKLINTDLPIEQIAFGMGFPSSTNFSAYFKKYTKVSPLTYRNLHCIPADKPGKLPSFFDSYLPDKNKV
jgi:LacI family transcriptional regulator